MPFPTNESFNPTSQAWKTRDVVRNNALAINIYVRNYRTFANAVTNRALNLPQLDQGEPKPPEKPPVLTVQNFDAVMPAFREWEEKAVMYNPLEVD